MPTIEVRATVPIDGMRRGDVVVVELDERTERLIEDGKLVPVVTRGR